MQGEYIYVGHSHGDTTIDGKPVKWDKVQLSNGVRTMEVLNGTGKTSFSFEPEKSKVIATFEIVPVKGDTAKVRLIKLDEKK